jgi:hypothetical protein
LAPFPSLALDHLLHQLLGQKLLLYVKSSKTRLRNPVVLDFSTTKSVATTHSAAAKKRREQ